MRRRFALPWFFDSLAVSRTIVSAGVAVAGCPI
jgi:hypothetical protein